ncbi:MAG: glycosyltransferase family 2 protein, partial [Alcanivoracaceae bacterium]|nr:glycosyltransferase family 2 protein [Alcanivoracaceae bacterium]
MNSLIVIPALNEESSIQSVIEKLHTDGLHNILVVNDFSTDDTAKIVSDNNVELINLPLQLGAWGATQTGIRYALKNGYKYVITMDADGQHLSSGTKSLKKHITKSGANVVIGTYTQRLSRSKRVAWWFFKAITHLKIEDLTSGFRIYDRKAMRILSSSAASLLDYQDVGVLLLLTKANMQISEIEVPMINRENGKSKIFYSWWMVLKYMVQTTTLCIAKSAINK